MDAEVTESAGVCDGPAEPAGEPVAGADADGFTEADGLTEADGFTEAVEVCCGLGVVQPISAETRISANTPVIIRFIKILLHAVCRISLCPNLVDSCNGDKNGSAA